MSEKPQPTKAECIAWLELWLAQYCQIVPPDNKAFVINMAILRLLKNQTPAETSEKP